MVYPLVVAAPSQGHGKCHNDVTVLRCTLLESWRQLVIGKAAQLRHTAEMAATKTATTQARGKTLSENKFEENVQWWESEKKNLTTFVKEAQHQTVVSLNSTINSLKIKLVWNLANVALDRVLKDKLEKEIQGR